jgi:hypothetical protein
MLPMDHVDLNLFQHLHIETSLMTNIDELLYRTRLTTLRPIQILGNLECN